MLGKLPLPGRLIILNIVRQEPIALAIGAGGGCLDIFLLSIISVFYLLSPSLDDGPIKTAMLFKGVTKPKTTRRM